MLVGTNISLRPVRATDVDVLYDAQIDLRNRGSYFPRGVLSETSFRDAFHETGMWQREEGTLLIIGERDEIVGHIEFHVPISYWDAFELSYVPENAASRRIAEKCGVALEGTARGGFYNDGRSQDVHIYSLLRTDPRPWSQPA